MSFQRSSPLPPRFTPIRGAVRAAEQKIAAAWPKVMWSEAEIKQLQSANFPNISVAEALVAVGVLKVRKSRRHLDHNFDLDDGWQNGEHNYFEEVSYEVIGTLMTLINDIHSTIGIGPYFISFHSAGGRAEAGLLHDALRGAGINGFLSDELQTGAQWRKDILQALRDAGLVFLVESNMYHTRPRCQIERDFAVAAGKRVIRVGLCDRSDLQGCPPWINGDINHANFVAAGKFDLNSVLGLPISQPLALNIRKRGGAELIRNLVASEVRTLAGNLNLEDELSGSDADQRNQLARIAFATVPQADRFCDEINLLPMF